MKQQPDQNQLAYMLADEFQKTVIKFTRKCPAININGIIGAANIFIASWHTRAPNKEIALQAVEKSFAIIREILNTTPEYFFGGGVQKPDLS